MEAANEEELKKLDEQLAEAEKIEGESDISDALKARANYLTRIGDKPKSSHSKRYPGSGHILTILHLGFFSDTEIVTTNVDKAEKLVEGGDWCRRNRLKVYAGFHFLSVRQFKRGGELLLDALSTFTATELLSYNFEFVGLPFISNTLGLKRVDLKKLINAPEVNQVLPEIPVLGDLVKDLYECHYGKFFVALATLEQTHFIPSRLLFSLTLDSLCSAFAVGKNWVDAELSLFIAAGRLHASIDKVHGIVETTRPSFKSTQYETVVKQGDVLLNEVQRLNKVLY